jgi:hypothetical protein
MRSHALPLRFEGVESSTKVVHVQILLWLVHDDSLLIGDVLESRAYRVSDRDYAAYGIRVSTKICNFHVRFQSMERTEREGITNFLETEKVTLYPSTAPSIFLQNSTKGVGYEQVPLR